MQSPPDDLAESALASALAHGWGVAVASMAYRAVGFGSHHWDVVDTGGTRWFLTADELDTRRYTLDEPLDAAFARLCAALAAARDLYDHGGTFAVAPVPNRDGAPAARIGDRFAVALYPYVDGRSFTWGEFGDRAQRRAMLDLVVAVHTAPPAARERALADDFAIPHRDELAATIDGVVPADCGPYARPTARLLAEHATPLRRLLARYDELTGVARAQRGGAVLTHGEPHPGNTMLSAGGWRLVDWDTALVAPPERDLWMLAAAAAAADDDAAAADDDDDGTVADAYAAATGVAPQPDLLALYRIGWDLKDLAMYVSRFRAPHPGNADDDKSWQGIRAVVKRWDARTED